MKKTISKVMSLLIAIFLSLGAVSSAFAAENPDSPTVKDTKSVTVHKIVSNSGKGGRSLADISKALTEGYDLNKITLGDKLKEGEKEVAGVYFKLQKLNNGIEATEENLKKDENWSDVEGKAGLTTSDGLKLDTAGLNGQFRIVEVHEESTYVGDDGETLTDSLAVPVLITLPLVNNSGVVEDAHVYPKNTENKPGTTKTFDADKAENDDFDSKDNSKTENISVGTVVPYIVTTKVPANSNYKTANWFDNMTEGLTYNDDLIIKIGNTTINKENMSNYVDYAKENNGFKAILKDEGLKLINGQPEEVTVTLQYTATLNSKAVVAIPESNDVTFHYGNNPGHGNTPVPNKPKDNKITVTKTWAEGVVEEDKVEVTVQLYNAQTGEKVGDSIKLNKDNNWSYTWEALDNDIEYKVVEENITGFSAEYTKGEVGRLGVKNRKDNNPKPENPDEPKVVTGGAKFVKTDNAPNPKRLKDAVFLVFKKDGNTKQYLKGTNLDRSAFEAAQKAYEEAVKNNTGVDAARKARDNAWTATLENMNEWTTKKDEALKLTSNDQGQFEIAGLKDGEYGLEEFTQPEGYAKIDDITFVITENKQKTVDIDYGADTKDNDAKRVINQQITIPQTGGIGTLIFGIIGVGLMVGAIVAMKKRNEAYES